MSDGKRHLGAFGQGTGVENDLASIQEASLKPEKDVMDFIQTVVNSLIMWELVIFLWNNPGITDKAQGIATRLGRRKEDIFEPLEVLVKHEILEKWGEDSSPVYAYRQDSKFAKAIEKFVEFNRDSEGKLWIWTQLLHKGLR
jgi:hypothetical protein